MSEVCKIKNGVRLTKYDQAYGDIPFVGATDSNNGITQWTSTKNSSYDKNVLGVNYNGSVVENFYHPYSAIFSDDVKRLELRGLNANKYHYLFLKSEILKQRNKYAYGYKFNTTRMASQKITLPITPSHTPDFAFMEQYMKRMENKVLEKVEYV